MKKKLYFSVLLTALAAVLTACHDDETYAEQKEKEAKAINAFLQRDVVIRSAEGDTLRHIGRIKVIQESQFLAQDSTTDLEENQYVVFKNSGVYMQIVRRGVGERILPGQSKQVLTRFLEYNILGDSLQLRDEVPYWATDEGIMDVVNVSSSISATWNTTYHSGGAMYTAYNETKVPDGWKVPLNYIRIGRQNSEEGIALVRLIVPHSQGHQNATKGVYPCFYEISYQQTRD